MIKWKSYYQRIPASVKLGKNNYEVLWIDGFPKDKKQMGESRFDACSPHNQIVININQSIKESVLTYWHEICHILSFEFDINLTEQQVINLEKSLPFLLKSGNIFSGVSSASHQRKRRNSKPVRQTSKKTR